MWRLCAAATLPCIQKGRHASHHRERKENLTKTIYRNIYIQITEASESGLKTKTMSKTTIAVQ